MIITSGELSIHRPWKPDKKYFSDEIRINPVPKSIENVSKELIKLKWDSEEVECFNGFGPWMKPAGFQVR